ncbi:MAG: orotidine-5'-phosphate decarboxylase [Desulfosalsimonadaceae bacterium]
MRKAEDYIVFPLDVPTMAAAKEYVSKLGPFVGMFKVGLELFIQCGPDVLSMIRQESNASLFLDLKLHDIPATVSRAMSRIASYGVDFATVHCGESRAMLEAAAEGGRGRVKVLAVTVLTSVSADDIAQAGFRQEFSNDLFSLVLVRAEQAKTAGCAGIVCSGQEVGEIKKRLGKDFIALTPGIRPGWGGAVAAKEDQKRTVTPAEAVSRGSDYLVVGRPIRDAADPAEAARRLSTEIAAALGASE